MQSILHTSYWLNTCDDREEDANDTQKILSLGVLVFSKKNESHPNPLIKRLGNPFHFSAPDHSSYPFVVVVDVVRVSCLKIERKRQQRKGIFTHGHTYVRPLMQAMLCCQCCLSGFWDGSTNHPPKWHTFRLGVGGRSVHNRKTKLRL